MKPKSMGGSDDIDNAIPVCFDCHAEVESTGPRGRRYTEQELRLHKQTWLTSVEERPELLTAHERGAGDAGPLEALLSELELNRFLLIGDAVADIRPLHMAQFTRSIAANAIGVLDDQTRSALFKAYGDINKYQELYRGWSSHPIDEDTYKAIGSRLNEQRQYLRSPITNAIAALKISLGVTH